MIHHLLAAIRPPFTSDFPLIKDKILIFSGRSLFLFRISFETLSNIPFIGDSVFPIEFYDQSHFIEQG